MTASAKNKNLAFFFANIFQGEHTVRFVAVPLHCQKKNSCDIKKNQNQIKKIQL